MDTLDEQNAYTRRCYKCGSTLHGTHDCDPVASDRMPLDHGDPPIRRRSRDMLDQFMREWRDGTGRPTTAHADGGPGT